MKTGFVKWFNDSKGFGYIQLDSGEEVFVHFSALADSGVATLAEGQRVQLETVEGANGQQAANVKLSS